jgi:hypothetical protein
VILLTAVAPQYFLQSSRKDASALATVHEIVMVILSHMPSQLRVVTPSCCHANDIRCGLK